jgi:phosphatidate cytidylyltransferase
MAKLFNKLTTRIIVAVVGIPAVVLVSLFGKLWFLAFVALIGLAGYLEFSRMARNRKYYPNPLIGSVSVAAIISNAYFHYIEFHVLVILIVSLLLILELFRNRESAIANLGTTFLGVFYSGLFASSLIDLREFYKDSAFTYSQGGYLIISILATIWVCDSAAYFIGSALGNNKILPRVSPNKSWEGSFAGFIFSIIVMLACKPILADFLEWRDAIVIGLIVGIIGQAGDFIESLLKRDAHVKDSSSFIPGHGGVLDRFDSLLFTAPIVYLYLNFLTK